MGHPNKAVNLSRLYNKKQLKDYHRNKKAYKKDVFQKYID